MNTSKTNHHITEYTFDIGEDTVSIRKNSTVIGFCRFNQVGNIEDIYVDIAYRMMGFGKILIAKTQEITGKLAFPLEPISPLGKHLFKKPMQTPIANILKSFHSICEYTTECSEDTLQILDGKTRIAYCQFTQQGEIEHIYVHIEYRLMGFAKILLSEVKKSTGHHPTPREPVSSLGRLLFKQSKSEQNFNTAHRTEELLTA
jgi:ribosomal protein S18 acetylase RimI-like enzyme